jgi:hypothetical protein
MHALVIDPNALDGEQIGRMRCEAQRNLLRQVMEKRGWLASDLLRVPASEIAAIICAIQGKALDIKHLVLAVREFVGDQGRLVDA